MDELVEETLSNIETIYRKGGDNEQTIARLERIKERADALLEDLV
jgi:hypothetical protein